MEVLMLYFECWSCGIPFGLSQAFRDAIKSSDGFFYCPRGCKLGLGKSRLTELREEKERSERALQAQLNEANHARLIAEKTTKKAITDKRKVERRIAHGVCPCCNKTFADIANHMLTEHREFRLPSGKQPKQITGAVQ